MLVNLFWLLSNNASLWSQWKLTSLRLTWICARQRPLKTFPHTCCGLLWSSYWRHKVGKNCNIVRTLFCLAVRLHVGPIASRDCCNQMTWGLSRETSFPCSRSTWHHVYRPTQGPDRWRHCCLAMSLVTIESTQLSPRCEQKVKILMCKIFIPMFADFPQ